MQLVNGWLGREQKSVFISAGPPSPAAAAEVQMLNLGEKRW